MYLAYNTNGLAHHRLTEAFALLADLGYGGVALTPDVGHLDLCQTSPQEWEAVRRDLERRRLRCTVETGARYVLDPRRKHWPNLVTPDSAAAATRVDYYRRAGQLAAALGSPLISLWSGALASDESAARADTWQRLVDRLRRVLDEAARVGVTVCLEPEPGMFIATQSDYRELRQRLGRADLGTTIDVGHLWATEEGAPEDHLADVAEHLHHIQLDDGRRGVHEHLAIGEGEIDFPPFLAQLRRLGYSGALALELSRDSHRAVTVAADAYRRLAPLLEAS